MLLAAMEMDLAGVAAMEVGTVVAMVAMYQVEARLVVHSAALTPAIVMVVVVAREDMVVAMVAMYQVEVHLVVHSAALTLAIVMVVVVAREDMVVAMYQGKAHLVVHSVALSPAMVGEVVVLVLTMASTKLQKCK
jgi:hypothetical protein